MNKTYKTSEIAKLIGIHPNTVRLYEKIEFISKPVRKENGYRIFSDLHLEQIRLVRIALKVEIVQNGLRKKAVDIIKTSAKGDFNKAIYLANQYLQQLRKEQKNAEEAIKISEQLLSGEEPENNNNFLTRKQVSDYLQISMDTLRNWEMNGLLTVKRKQNGYRVYTDEDIRRLKIIRSLRCANYSLTAILRMLSILSRNPQANIREIIDTPSSNEDIISVCDKLLSSLKFAEVNANIIINQLEKMKHDFN